MQWLEEVLQTSGCLLSLLNSAILGKRQYPSPGQATVGPNVAPELPNCNHMVRYPLRRHPLLWRR